MGKLVKHLILFFVILCLSIFSACYVNDYKKMEECCYKINLLVKDIEFHTAKILENKIILYDDKHVKTEELSFEYHEDNKKIIGVRKEGAAIYFIISGSADDEQGIVFINDDSNIILDGIKSIKRIGGNSYRYSTSE